ncbi:ImmA/IrrE family metallo-endopeptidase [Mariniphaga sediminis]|uniref:ImmA/IrrE family metallo-endopeptidase n=1 Tax=Mariniphaga sediminis TaxID=1628158 RepID=A0A399D3Y7_9BACT|nr:ImmA/IrrE family metallo-endopeptidase [Mariniphaga sediminis]RIH66186.1 ImmA/IrrE family metallo-endopeptidase [Mariniphaga sediminis]
MIDEKLLEIGYLAESIAEEFIFENKVDPFKIAENQSISVISGNYQDYFIGELVFDTEEFFIHLNYDQLIDENSPRARFTLGHELGHYFIDEHRNLLKEGISLHKSDSEGGINYEIEKEANFFASNLLMPEKHFVNLSNQFEPGLETILNLRTQFNTSIESTVIRYAQLDISKCMIIKWNADITPKFISYSKSFASATGVKGRPALKVNVDGVKSQFGLLDSIDINTDYIEDKVSLSKWVPTIIPKTKRDVSCIEQTYRLGDYGGLTLLRLD